jgi:hypothetical protein
MASALMALVLSARPVDLDYGHRVDRREFSFRTADLRRELEGLALSHPRVRRWLLTFLEQGERELYSSEDGDLLEEREWLSSRTSKN